MVTIRYATRDDVDGITEVHVKSWQDAYASILPASFLDSISYENRQKMWENALQSPQVEHGIFVVEDHKGRIVGFASCGKNRDVENYHEFTGELFAIYLLSSIWGKGVGEKLFQEVTAHLRKNGLHSMLVWVLADNHARQFYEKMGGTEVGSTNIKIGDGFYEEIAYGWNAL